MEYRPLVYLEHCLKMLGNQAKVLSDAETKHQWNLLKKAFPFNRTGKIDWEKIKYKKIVNSTSQEISAALDELIPQLRDRSIYVEFSDADLPVIKTDLNSTLALLEDIKKVAAELFLFNSTVGYVVEILSNRGATVGLINMIALNNA